MIIKENSIFIKLKETDVLNQLVLRVRGKTPRRSWYNAVHKNEMTVSLDVGTSHILDQLARVCQNSKYWTDNVQVEFIRNLERNRTIALLIYG